MRPVSRVRVASTKVRSATPDEAEKLASLHVTTWQQAYAELLPNEYLLSLTPAQRLPMWQQLLNSPERVAIFVADHEGNPIGFSCGGISNDEDAGSSTGEMWSIYLLREFWSKGIGSDLHDVLLEELKRRGFDEATLWVMESNERTRRWYERQGWTTDGSQKSDELGGAAISEVRYRRPLEVNDDA